jgi:hypothetical protein
MLLQELNLSASQSRELSVEDVGKNQEKSFFYIGDTAFQVIPVPEYTVSKDN